MPACPPAEPAGTLRADIVRYGRQVVKEPTASARWPFNPCNHRDSCASKNKGTDGLGTSPSAPPGWPASHTSRLSPTMARIGASRASFNNGGLLAGLCRARLGSPESRKAIPGGIQCDQSLFVRQETVKVGLGLVSGDLSGEGTGGPGLHPLPGAPSKLLPAHSDAPSSSLARHRAARCRPVPPSLTHCSNLLGNQGGCLSWAFEDASQPPWPSPA